MSESKRALVLHVVNSGEPLVFELSDKGARSLESRLVPLLNSGAVEAAALADGSTAAINFGHVVSAHLDKLPPMARVYGSTERRAHGFAG